MNWIYFNLDVYVGLEVIDTQVVNDLIKFIKL